MICNKNINYYHAKDQENILKTKFSIIRLHFLNSLHNGQIVFTEQYPIQYPSQYRMYVMNNDFIKNLKIY